MKPKTPQKASKASRKPGLRDLATLDERAKQIKAGIRIKRTRK